MNLDRYVFVARWTPCAIVLLPLGLGISAWYPEMFATWRAVFGAGALAALSVLFAEIGRDPGKAKEALLFKTWGGKPTTQLLRWSYEDSATEVGRLRNRSRLAELSGIRFPDRGSEAAAPEAADSVYEAAVDYLRGQTRDVAKFRLLMAENRSYGFRRNLWGMRASGAVVSILGGGSSFVAAALNSGDRRVIAAGLGVFCVFLLALYLVRITKTWVRTAAFDYAKELLASVDLVAESAASGEKSLIIL